MSKRSRIVALGTVALILAASVLYSRAVRRAYLTDDLRFVPKENALLLVAGDIRSLWEAVDDHFGEIIRDDRDGEAGFLFETFEQLREGLEEDELEIDELGDLSAYGIDVDRGLVLSMKRVEEESVPLLLMHLTDTTTFLESLSQPLSFDLVPELSDPPYSPEPITASAIRRFTYSLSDYLTEFDRYPGPTEGWLPADRLEPMLGDLYPALPTDRWNRPLVYWSDGATYRLASMGPDGKLDRDWQLENGEPATVDHVDDIVFGEEGRIHPEPVELDAIAEPEQWLADWRRGTGNPGPRVVAPSNEDPFVALSGPDGPVIFVNPEDRMLLHRALLSTRSNMRYALENDALYESLRHRLRRPLAVGPSLFLFWRPRELPGVAEIVALVRLTDTEIRLEAEVKVHRGVLQLADRFFETVPEPVPWPRYLDPRTAGVVVVEDQALSSYLRFLARFGEVRAAMAEHYGGVLAELGGVPELRRVLLAATGYRDGLPELLMGIWAEPRALDDLVGTLKLRHRQARDRFILDSAQDSFREAFGRSAVSVRELLEAGLLVEERHSSFERYPLGDPETEDSDLGQDDLENPTYLHRYGNHEFEFLLPSVTANDLKYVSEFAEQDRESLQSDRYRLATVVLDDILWVASDVRELEALVDRAAGAHAGINDNPSFRAVSAEWRGHEKIEGFVDIDALTTLGLLSPESEIQEQARHVLLDLRDHPAIAFELHTVPAEDRVSLSVRLLRRTALAAR